MKIAQINPYLASYANITFTAGVAQSSILASLLFLIYINDLSNELSSNRRLFADGTSLLTL